MSLLAAILSQTNKILGTLINFTNSFPLSTINTINTNTQPSAIASDTQTGLNNQGYSTGRAGNLDNLNTTVSSRAVQARMQPFISGNLTGNTSGTILNVSGQGFIHAVSGNSSSNLSFAVIIDGVTVTNTAGGPSGAFFIQPNGVASNTQNFRDQSNADIGMGGTMMWPFRSSLQITYQILGGNNGTYTIGYSVI